MGIDIKTSTVVNVPRTGSARLYSVHKETSFLRDSSAVARTSTSQAVTGSRSYGVASISIAKTSRPAGWPY